MRRIDDDLPQPHQYCQQPPTMAHVQPNILQPPVTPQSHLTLHQPVRAPPQLPSISQLIWAAILSPTGPIIAPQCSQQAEVAPPLSDRTYDCSNTSTLNKMKGPALESATINKLPLVEKYKSLKSVGTVGTLAVKIARESCFGQEVFARCTVYGHRVAQS